MYIPRPGLIYAATQNTEQFGHCNYRSRGIFDQLRHWKMLKFYAMQQCCEQQFDIAHPILYHALWPKSEEVAMPKLDRMRLAAHHYSRSCCTEC